MVIVGVRDGRADDYKPKTPKWLECRGVRCEEVVNVPGALWVESREVPSMRLGSRLVVADLGPISIGFSVDDIVGALRGLHSGAPNADLVAFRDALESIDPRDRHPIRMEQYLRRRGYTMIGIMAELLDSGRFEITLPSGGGAIMRVEYEYDCGKQCGGGGRFYAVPDCTVFLAYYEWEW